MMPGIRVMTDSACDLPPALVAEHGIDIVPLTIRFGEEEFVDRRDLSPADFWSRLTTSTALPETAAPAPGAFEEAYRRAAGDGAEGVLCVTISADLSATYQSAQVAAQAVGDTIPVRVVDSRSVTMAQGLMAVAAAQGAARGHGLEEVSAAVEDLIPRSRIFATLDTLEFARRSGRVSGVQALMGSMLSIKPVIEVTNGKVEQDSKQRTRGKALRYVVDKVRQHQPVKDLAVMHGQADDIEQFVSLLQELYPAEDLVVGNIGPVVGTHVGPGVVGVTFFTG